MKNNTAFLFILMVVFISCTKIRTCKLENIVSNGYKVLHYEYDNNGVIRVYDYDDTDPGLLEELTYIIRDESGKISAIKVYDQYGKLHYEYLITYNSTGKPGVCSKWQNLDADDTAEDFLTSTTYFFGNDNKLDSLHFNIGFTDVHQNVVTWTGNNVTGLIHKLNQELVGSKTYTFDSSPSLSKDLKDYLLFTSISSGEMSVAALSENNEVGYNAYDASGNPAGYMNYAYTYNADGFVESAFGGFINCEYNCTEE